jgi:hypothetical protein
VSTDRIRPGSSAADLLRAIAAASGKTRAGGAPAAGEARPPPAGPHDQAVLRGRLAPLLRGVDVADETQLRALRRPVVREILLWEFGADFRQHAEFSPMLDAIEQALDADPAMPARFAELVRHLKQGAPAR